MKKDIIEITLLFIAIVGPIGAWVVFWVGKIVNLNGKIKELEMDRKYDRQEINQLKEDVKDLRNKWDRVT